MGPIDSLNTEVKGKYLPLPEIELRFPGCKAFFSLITIMSEVVCLSWYVGIQPDMGKQRDM
jgi:hypothetical protein